MAKRQGAKLNYAGIEYRIDGEDSYVNLQQRINRTLLGMPGHEPVFSFEHERGETTIYITSGVPITLEPVDDYDLNDSIH